MTLYAQTRTIPGFAGAVVRPGDAGYDEGRAIWNAMHDRRPAVIAYCASTADVAAAVTYGRRHDLPIAVRGGGHSMPGHSVCDDGIVIDLRGLNRVDIDPGARRGTVGGGALLGEVDRATQRHGLVVPAGVVSHTGVGGLTLGGGVGRLMRRFGLTVDSLRGAEVVTAGGEIVRATDDENPELFWALRGGGGNFGVVTAFEFALHELSEVVILATFHRLADAAGVLARGRTAMGPEAPDELLWTSFLRKAPPLPWVPADLIGEPGVMSLVEWSGETGEGIDRLAALRAELQPVAASLEPVAFLTIQTLTDDIFAAGKRTYIKAGFLTDLTDDAIVVLCEGGAGVRSALSQIEVLAMGGAIARVPVGATAFPHRDARWLINIPAMWEDVADTEGEVAWTRATFAALEPHLTGGTYVNFMGDDDAGGTTGAYGATLARLRRIKRSFDPENVFRFNQNIQPG